MMRYYEWSNCGIFGILIAFLLIALIVIALFKILKSDTGSKKMENEALEILNQRYAKGEISEDEYLQKKKNIQG